VGRYTTHWGLFAAGAVLTSLHILRDEDGDRLHDLFVIGRFSGHHSWPVQICVGRPAHGELRRDRDLALIRCDTDMDGRAFDATDWPALGPQSGDRPGSAGALPEPGTAIYVLGYPERAGGMQTLSAGEVTGAIAGDEGRAPTQVRSTAAIGPGSSGGPVLDERGRLLGLASAYRLRVELSPTGDRARVQGRVGLFVPIAEAADLLALARSGWQTGRTAAVAALPSPPDPEIPIAETARTSERATGPAGAPDPSPDSIGRSGAVTVLSRVADADNDQPIAGAVMIVFKPDISADEIEFANLDSQVFSWGRSDEYGELVVERPLPRGATYTVAILAEGYRPLSGDGALRLDADTPALFDPWGIIRLAREL
ncbi:MAG: serine protease, partial [Myxococcota bacterium]